MSPWKSGDNGKDGLINVAPSSPSFLSSTPLSTPCLILSPLVYICRRICPSPNCPPLALIGLVRSLGVPFPLVQSFSFVARRSTFAENASKASYKASCSSSFLLFNDGHFLPFNDEPCLPFNDTPFPLSPLNHYLSTLPSPSLPSSHLTFQSLVLSLKVFCFIAAGLPKFAAAVLPSASACVYGLSVMPITTIEALAKWIRPKASARAPRGQSNQCLTGTRVLLRRR